ncbi:MAG: HAD family hydrolase [Ruminococcus sp.]|nr:HAD family hydrolase [Ruminococcus sp.]
MIFVDFDGTLVDLWPRYHAVFTALCDLNSVTVQEYKEVKQRLVFDEKVAKYFGKKLCKNYFEKKAKLLEDKEYLALDRLFLQPEAINQAFIKNDAILLSKRRNKKHFKWELEQMGLYVPSIVISDTSKKDWILEEFPGKRCIIIGDSIADLEAAQLNNVNAFMVDFGLGTEEQFIRSGIPFRMLRAATQILDIMEGYKNAIS